MIYRRRFLPIVLVLILFACNKTEPKSLLEIKKEYLVGRAASLTSWKLNGLTIDSLLYVVKESGQFSCRGFRCLNVGFFLLKIVVFVFLGTVV